MPKPLSTEKQIENFHKVHNNFYDYSLVAKVGSETVIKIICKIHGDFEKSVRAHNAGGKCPGCHKTRGRNSTVHLKKCKQLKEKYKEVIEQFNIEMQIGEQVYVNCDIHGKVKTYLARLDKIKCCPICYKQLLKKQYERNCILKKAKKKQETIIKRLRKKKQSKLFENFKSFKFKEYRRQVSKITEAFYRNQPDLIDPNYNLLPRGKCDKGKNTYNIDHMYSVADGFKNNISPHVVGHWTNLCLIPWEYNVYKGKTSNISKEMLFSKYEWGTKRFGI